MRRGLVAVIVTLIAAASAGACSSESDGSTTTSTLADLAGSPTSVATVKDIEESLVLGPAAPTPGPTWEPLVSLPYGEADNELGLADTHGGANLPVGPEYLAPAADGTLWVLDVQKYRVARFESDGTYLGATQIPGKYAGVQLPFMLGDTFWASGSGSDGALVIDPEGAIRVGESPGWDHSDGTGVYDPTGTSRLVPGRPPTTTGVDALLTPTGTPYRVKDLSDGPGTLRVSLPDVRSDTLIRVTSSLSGNPVEVLGYEFVADGADRLNFFVLGIDSTSPDVQLAGYFIVDATSGEVSPMEPMSKPFSVSDPASPAHVRAVPDSDSVLLTFIGDDGVHVYKRK